MRYTVIVEKPAENQLARIWTAAPDQQAVADASDRIDRELANDAHLLKGVPLGVFRKYTDDPLAVLFHADPGDRMVRIIQYRRTR
jgi:hypothetical protein